MLAIWRDRLLDLADLHANGCVVAKQGGDTESAVLASIVCG
jgi:hypothetical protein